MSRRLSGIAYIGTMFAFVFLLSLFIFPGFSVNAARYASGETDYVVGVDSNITIMLPKENVSFMVEPGAEEVTAEKFQIGIYSNLPFGITVGMNTARIHTSENDKTANGLNSIHGNTLISIDNVVHESLFPVNRWGYSLDGKYYYRMPAADDDYMAEIKIDSMEESGIKDVWVGSKVDTSQPLDYYYGTINFTVVTNVATKTIYDILYMQEMDGDVAESMVTNKQYRLRDIRDNKEYWVSKLDNGEVWMTQDLDLVLKPGMTLTSDNTDIKRDSWVSNYDMTEINRDINQAVSTTTSATYYNYEEDGTTRTVSGKVYGADIDECLLMNSDNPKFCNHFLTGQAYTFLQASAVNDISDLTAEKSQNITSTSYLAVRESICPKNWRMPVTTEFPKVPSATVVTKTDENGRTLMTATLDASLVHEPYYLGNYVYLTAMISNDYQYHYYYNYASPTSTSGYSISSNKAYTVRCMARLTRNTFTIKYDLNGGTGNKPADDVFETWDDTHAFLLPSPSPKPYREGYNFVGWATTPDATVPEYIPYQYKKDWYYYAEGQYVATTPETTLYAVWEPAIIVGFNANGGTFSSYSEALGETPERTVYGFSTPTVLDEAKVLKQSYRPRRASDDNSKQSIYDTEPYKNTLYTSGHWTSWTTANAGPDKIQVTIYYAIPGDSILCVHQNSSIDTSTYNCSNSVTGNLAEDAPINASNTPIYKKVFEVPCDRVSYGPKRCDDYNFNVFFKPGASNNDGTTNWYGFWIDEEYIYYNKAFQYRRFGTGNGGHYEKPPTRSGYRFLGWSKNPDATSADWTYDAWDDSVQVYFEEDVEVYAVWQKYVPFNIEVTTNDPEHVDILIPTIAWNTGKSSPTIYRDSSNNTWYYNDRDENNQYRNYIVATFHGSQDDFYKPTIASYSQVSVSPYANWYAIPENATVSVTLNYSETKVETMQDLNRDACIGAPIGLSRQLTDTRDNKKYWISKLADGACWMTQNMDFEFTLGSYTVVPTTSGNQSIYTESTWNKSNNSNVNNYFDGGDYYYADGTTPTSTEGLAEDAEEWHYHRGSYYNYHIAKYLCQTGSWQLGDFRNLLGYYLINQPNANSYTFAYTQAPLADPLYLILESKDSDITKPDDGYTSTSSSLRALYWTQIYQRLDVIRETSTSNQYVPLEMFYSQSAEPSTFYGLTNTVTLNGAGFVRCMVK